MKYRIRYIRICRTGPANTCALYCMETCQMQIRISDSCHDWTESHDATVNIIVLCSVGPRFESSTGDRPFYLTFKLPSSAPSRGSSLGWYSFRYPKIMHLLLNPTVHYHVWSLSWVRWIQSTNSYICLFEIHFNVILQFMLFLSDLLIKISYASVYLRCVLHYTIHYFVVKSVTWARSLFTLGRGQHRFREAVRREQHSWSHIAFMCDVLIPSLVNV